MKTVQQREGAKGFLKINKTRLTEAALWRHRALFYLHACMYATDRQTEGRSVRLYDEHKEKAP